MAKDGGLRPLVPMTINLFKMLFGAQPDRGNPALYRRQRLPFPVRRTTPPWSSPGICKTTAAASAAAKGEHPAVPLAQAARGGLVIAPQE